MDFAFYIYIILEVIENNAKVIISAENHTCWNFASFALSCSVPVQIVAKSGMVCTM
jgi:hypothetical protein